MKRINGIEVVANAFAFDGCHKIYLLNDGDAIVDAEEKGYDIYDIDGIVEAFDCACPLRFINEWGGDFKSIIPQSCDKITFEGFFIHDDLESFEYEIKIDENSVQLTSFNN